MTLPLNINTNFVEQDPLVPHQQTHLQNIVPTFQHLNFCEQMELSSECGYMTSIANYNRIEYFALMEARRSLAFFQPPQKITIPASLVEEFENSRLPQCTSLTFES